MPQSETLMAPFSAPSPMPWRGIHHVALSTPDLDVTLQWYSGVLGMTVTQVFPATERSGRHAFVRPGDTEALGLHFFEQPDAQLFPYPDAMPRFAFVPGALQHLAFALPNLAEGYALRERLVAAGLTVTPINTLGSVQNILFRDPHGLLLEATWPYAGQG